MKTLSEVIAIMDGIDQTCTCCAYQHDCDETECIDNDALYYLKEYRISDSFLDTIISEQNEIMKKNYDGKEKDPEMFMKFAMARCIKTYLLKKYAEQKNDVMHGHWLIDKNGEEICSVCWTPRKTSELNGECVMCGARIEEE